jgi:hypothetical protein
MIPDHWAKSVVLEVKGKLGPSAEGVPLPSAAVFQPEKLKPLLLSVFDLNAVAVDAA